MPKFNDDNTIFEITIEDVGGHFVNLSEVIPLALYRSTDVTGKVKNFQIEGIRRLTGNPLNFS